MTELTRRERLTRCYFHQEQDRPCVYVRTAFPPDDPGYDRLKAYMAAHTELKAFWDTAGEGIGRGEKSRKKRGTEV